MEKRVWEGELYVNWIRDAVYIEPDDSVVISLAEELHSLNGKAVRITVEVLNR
jgi:hypothetical protein